ncbi:MAG TPA: penicillin acylase family protein, partial [Gemmatimonadaceae bacterium]|nr:penicillin acylase family protein [Gemmatimonadaceae bacterium]
MRSRTPVVVALAAVLVLALPGAAGAERLRVPGLRQPADMTRTTLGVPQIHANNAHDAYFTQGYLHASDRLFQMDQSRRQASGRLAELLGPSAIAGDVQLRTLGLRRAAVRSLDALSAETRAALDAYAEGVNAWIAANPLPSEYGALELTKASVPEWTALDSVTVGKLLAFGLSFGLDDISNTQKLIAYQTAGAGLGFNGAALFFQDVMRSEPFAHAPSIRPGEISRPVRTHGRPDWSKAPDDEDLLAAAEKAMKAGKAAGIGENPIDVGSNAWVVAGSKSTSGRAMVANDPHLSLSSPSVFYEVGYRITGGPDGQDLYGVSFPGAPGIVQGTNGRVSWGSTVNPTDVTDVYNEELLIQGGVPVATRYKGQWEPTTII